MSLKPGMIEFAKLDLGEKASYSGISATGIDAPKVWYPTLYLRRQDKPIDLPDRGTAKISFRVTRRSSETNDGKTQHSASLEVMSIETEETGKRKAETGKAKKLRPGMIGFSHEFDSRPRNGNGQFVANETGGADPNSMAAAYGKVAQDEQRKVGLLQRLMRMAGRGGAPE